VTVSGCVLRGLWRELLSSMIVGCTTPWAICCEDNPFPLEQLSRPSVKFRRAIESFVFEFLNRFIDAVF